MNFPLFRLGSFKDIFTMSVFCDALHGVHPIIYNFELAVQNSVYGEHEKVRIRYTFHSFHIKKHPLCSITV